MPLALPDAPLVTVIHAALLTPVQLHPLVVVTPVLSDPPVAVADCDVEDNVKLQAAACVTVNVCPAIVRVPVRERSEERSCRERV